MSADETGPDDASGAQDIPELGDAETGAAAQDTVERGRHIPSLSDRPDDGRLWRVLAAVAAVALIVAGTWWFLHQARDTQQRHDEEAAAVRGPAKPDTEYRIAGRARPVRPPATATPEPEAAAPATDPRLAALLAQLDNERAQLELAREELAAEREGRANELEKLRLEFDAKQAEWERQAEAARRRRSADAKQSETDAKDAEELKRNQGSAGVLYDDSGAAAQAAPTRRADNQVTIGGELADEPPLARAVPVDGTSGASGPAVARSAIDPCFLMNEGDVLTASLETRLIHPGPQAKVVAHLARPYRAQVGCPDLLPAMTRLIGVRNTTSGRGDTSIQVSFRRAKHEDTGLNVRLVSPGTGLLGEGGLPAERHTQFWKRFGNTLILEFLLSGTRELTSTNDGRNDQRQVIGNTLGQSASFALQDEVDIPELLIKDFGEVVQVTVDRDIDFTAVF